MMNYGPISCFIESTPQTHFADLNNRKMFCQILSHFLHSAQNFPIEHVN